MYRINDLVVCQGLGPCRIINVYPASCDNLSYDVMPLPEGNEPATILFHQIKRHVMTRDAALEAIDRMPYLRTIQASTEKLRRDVYEAALETYDPTQWIGLIKSAYLRRQDGKTSDFEAELCQLAKAWLHRELSVVLDLPLGNIELRIQEILKADW